MQDYNNDRRGSINPILRITILMMSLFTILGVGIWLSPRVLAIYYQSIGGQIIDNVIPISKNTLNVDFACVVNPLEDEYSRIQATRALENLKKALEYYPRSPQAYMLIGRAYCLLGNPIKAVEAFQEYTNLKPNNPLGFAELVFAYKSFCRNLESNQTTLATDNFSICRNANSITDIRNANKYSGASASDYMNAGTQLLNNADDATALEFFEIAIIVNPQSRESWLTIGTIFEQRSDFSKAIDSYKHAIDIDPSQVDAYYKLADLYLTKTNNFEAALNVYTAAAIIDPIPINAYIGIGTSQDRLGANSTAIIAYKKAIELSSKIVVESKEDRRKKIWPRYKLGEVYIRVGELNEAKKMLQSALDLDNHMEWTDYLYWAMGRISLLENQPNQSIQDFIKALNTSKYSTLRSQIFFDLASVYISEGDLDQGINYLRESNSEDPSSPNTYLLLADILLKTGRKDEAVNVYIEYLNHWPEDESVKKLIDKINHN